jgi:HK97 family phage prohead protease
MSTDLSDSTLDALDRFTGWCAPHAKQRVIHVPIDQCEWRDSGDPEKPNETTLRGHAAVFNSLSDDLGGFRELIAPGFFRASLRKQPDVRLLFNHDPNYVMGRTASGTLELREDNRGLHVFARVDKTIGWVNDLRTSMQRGDVDQMSFAFTVREGGDDWAVTDDESIVRTLLPDGAEQLFDVSVVTYPAYKATEVSMRSVLEDAIARGRLPDLAGAEPGTATGVAEDEGVVSGVEERADVPSIARLVSMYECGQDFLQGELLPDDAPERGLITDALALIDQAIAIEAVEPGDPGVPVDDEMEMVSAQNALAELRSDSKQTLRAEKESYLRLLKEITR